MSQIFRENGTTFSSSIAIMGFVLTFSAKKLEDFGREKRMKISVGRKKMSRIIRSRIRHFRNVFSVNYHSFKSKILTHHVNQSLHKQCLQNWSSQRSPPTFEFSFHSKSSQEVQMLQREQNFQAYLGKDTFTRQMILALLQIPIAYLFFKKKFKVLASSSFS